MVWCRTYSIYIAIIEQNHPEYDFNKVSRDLVAFLVKNSSLLISLKRLTDKQNECICEIIKKLNGVEQGIRTQQ